MSTSASSKPYRRKKLNLGIQRQFQLWMLKRMLLTVALCSLVAALILYFYARTEITASFFDAHIKIRRVSDLLLPVVVAGTLVSLLSGILAALFIPQKIAGPLHRIEVDLATVRNGDLAKRIHIRNDDILQSFANNVDTTVVALRHRLEEIKEVQRAVEQAVASSQDPTLMKLVERQKVLLAQLKT